jgi:hypothetical protein
MSLPGRDVTIFKVQDKIKACLQKCEIWSKRLGRGEYDSFSALEEFLRSSGELIDDELVQLFQNHITILQDTIKNIFQSLMKVRDGFGILAVIHL